MGEKAETENQPHGKRIKSTQYGKLKNGNPPCDIRSLPKCQATAKSTDNRCGNIAVKGRRVCRLHGGRSPGAPKNNKNALKHGFYTTEALARHRRIRRIINQLNASIRELDKFVI